MTSPFALTQNGALISAADSVCACPLVLDELQTSMAEGESLDVALDRVVALIANTFESDVGSFYLLHGGHLVLQATVGLLQSCVGRLGMRTDEGLVGLVAQRRAPVVLAEAARHPRFKYFPEADEDRYESFLGVPVACGRDLRGVLVVQTIDSRTFTDAEVQNLTRVGALIGLALDPLADG